MKDMRFIKDKFKFDEFKTSREGLTDLRDNPPFKIPLKFFSLY